MLVAQLYPTLCDSKDYSPPGSSVHGILQERILEWMAILFSNTVVMRYNNVNYLIPAAAAKSLQSCPIEVRSVWPYRRQPTRLPCPWDYTGKHTGVSCHCLLHYLTPYIHKNGSCYSYLNYRDSPFPPNILCYSFWFFLFGYLLNQTLKKITFSITHSIVYHYYA